MLAFYVDFKKLKTSKCNVSIYSQQHMDNENYTTWRMNINTMHRFINTNEHILFYVVLLWVPLPTSSFPLGCSHLGSSLVSSSEAAGPLVKTKQTGLPCSQTSTERTDRSQV